MRGYERRGRERKEVAGNWRRREREELTIDGEEGEITG